MLDFGAHDSFSIPEFVSLLLIGSRQENPRQGIPQPLPIAESVSSAFDVILSGDGWWSMNTFVLMIHDDDCQSR